MPHHCYIHEFEVHKRTYQVRAWRSGADSFRWEIWQRHRLNRWEKVQRYQQSQAITAVVVAFVQGMRTRARHIEPGGRVPVTTRLPSGALVHQTVKGI